MPQPRNPLELIPSRLVARAASSLLEPEQLPAEEQQRREEFQRERHAWAQIARGGVRVP